VIGGSEEVTAKMKAQQRYWKLKEEGQEAKVKAEGIAGGMMKRAEEELEKTTRAAEAARERANRDKEEAERELARLLQEATDNQVSTFSACINPGLALNLTPP